MSQQPANQPNQPNPVYPPSQPYPAHPPNQNYPAYQANQPNQAYPPNQPNQAYPPNQPAQAYPPGQPQGAYGASPSNAYPYQPPAGSEQPIYVQARRRSMLDSIKDDVNRSAQHIRNSVSQTVDKNWHSSLLNMFKQGNVIQLVSRASGRTVQIVSGPDGQLLLDANGPLDPGAFNTLWTVVNVGNNQVHLSNYNNFIAIVNGYTVLVSYGPGSTVGLETKLQLSQIQGQFVTLESVKDRKHHVGFTKAGELRPALATGKEIDAQFGVNVVLTPFL